MIDALNFALAKELDRFDVPPSSTGLADRIVAATMTSIGAPSGTARRDRRGMWRRGRQVLLGTVAVGLLSAGAIASGLLGRVGIEVPVLTAMLAPPPKPVIKHLHVASRPSETRTAAVELPAMIPEPMQTGADRPLLSEERMVIGTERRDRREDFAASHPVAAAASGERVHERLRRRAIVRRQALAGPPSMNFAKGAALVRAAHRDHIVAEKMVDRRNLARQAQMSENQVAGDGAPTGTSVPPTLPGGRLKPEAVSPAELAHEDGLPQRVQRPTPEERAARRTRFQQISSEQRIQMRDRMQQRRAMHFGLNRQHRRQK